MTIRFNHTIIAAKDRHASASFFASLFGLPEPTTWGPFTIVSLEDGVFLQFAEPPVEDIQMQHYAFLVDDEAFGSILGRARTQGLTVWADPQQKLEGQINTNHGGRGFYFVDPSGHGLEILTRPYQ